MRSTISLITNQVFLKCISQFFLNYFWINTSTSSTSIKMGDRWVSYDRIEPFSTVMGLVVDSMNALKTGRMRGESPGVGSIFKIVGQNFLDKTFTEGLGKAMLAMQEPDRYTELVRQAYEAQQAREGERYQSLTSDLAQIDADLEALAAKREGAVAALESMDDAVEAAKDALVTYFSGEADDDMFEPEKPDVSQYLDTSAKDFGRGAA